MKQEGQHNEQEQVERLARLLDAVENEKDKDLDNFVVLASTLRSLQSGDSPHDDFKRRLEKDLTAQARYQKLSLTTKVALFFKNIFVGSNPYSKFSAAMQPAVARVSMLALVAIAVVVGWQQFGNVTTQEDTTIVAQHMNSSQQTQSLFKNLFVPSAGLSQNGETQKDAATSKDDVVMINAIDEATSADHTATSDSAARQDEGKQSDDSVVATPTDETQIAKPSANGATQSPTKKEKEATFTIAAEVTVADESVDSAQITRVALGSTVTLSIVAHGDTTGLEYQFEDSGSGFGSVLQAWSSGSTLQWHVNKDVYLEKNVDVLIRARKQTASGLETQETTIAYYVYNPNDEVMLLEVVDGDGWHQTNSQAEEGDVSWSGGISPQKAHTTTVTVTATAKTAKYAPLEYRFIVENATGSRTVEQDWSANAVFSYIISNYTFVGQHLKIEIQIRDNNSSYRFPVRGADDYMQVSYLIFNTDPIFKYVKDVWTNTQENSYAGDGTVAWSAASPNVTRSVGDLIAMHARITDPDVHDEILFRYIFSYADGMREVVRDWAIPDDLGDTFAPEKARGQTLIVEVQTKDQNGVLRYPDCGCDDYTQLRYGVAE